MIRKLFLIFGLIHFCYSCLAQDFTNKGKDFWLCFPSHVPNQRDGVFYYAKMSLFITSDKASSGTITVPGKFNTTFSLLAGKVVEIDIPYNIAHINSAEAGTVVRKGIHVTVDNGKAPVIVYAHIYAGFRSAASLILPVNVLGKKYYSMNAPQNGIDNSKSQLAVVALTANTSVKITPSKEGVKGTPFIVDLPLEGDVYELQDDLDLSGTLIESVSTGTEICKKIAVFSGSSGINIATNNDCIVKDSYDPLYQQLYPVNVWGKAYGFIPFENYTNGNPYRILASENGTNISVGGTVVATINEGESFPSNANFSSNLIKNPVVIQTDKPVSVAQFAQSSACTGAPIVPGKGYGDADMVVLNPVEQNVNNITVFSSPKESIYPDSRFINILIPQSAANSFRINNIAPAASWNAVLPLSSGMSFAKIKLPVNQNAFSLSADTSFNAVTYGFGDYESYAYSAGTSVKDLYREVTVENESGFSSTPLSCRNTHFRIYVTYPYITNQLKWKFNGALTDQVINNPVPVDTLNVNGKTVYQYRLDNFYSLNQAGEFNFSVIANNASPDGCLGEDEISYIFKILEKPKAGFKYTFSGCLADSVQLNDISDSAGRNIQKWMWSFNNLSTEAGKNTGHKPSLAVDVKTQHWIINDIGCSSDTAEQIIKVTNRPSAGFDITGPYCQSAAIRLTDTSYISGVGSLAKSYWNFGDAITSTTNSNQILQHTYNSKGSYKVQLQVESNSGCKSGLLEKTINIQPKPIADFVVPVFCLPTPSTFQNKTTMSDGSVVAFTSSWTFGDGSLNSAEQSPEHNFVTTGPYSVKLAVITAGGCADSVSKLVKTIYDKTHIVAAIQTIKCFNDTVIVTVDKKSAEAIEFSSFLISEQQGTVFVSRSFSTNSFVNEKFLYAAPGDYLIQLVAQSKNGGCLSDTLAQQIHIQKSPVIDFSITGLPCEKSTLKFNGSIVNAESSINLWVWKFDNGAEVKDQNTSLAFNKGLHNIKLMAQDVNGCKSDAMIKQMDIKSNPTADFSFEEICSKYPDVKFFDQSVNNAGMLTYNWNFNDQKALPAQNISTLADPLHSFGDTGIYQIKLVVTSVEGCLNEKIKPLVVNGSKPSADFEIQNINTLCQGESITVKNKSTVDYGAIGKLQILWDTINAENNVNDEQPLVNKSYSHHYSDEINTEKEHEIKLIAFSGKGCSDSITKKIMLHALPKIVLKKFPTICNDADLFDLPSFVSVTNQQQGTGSFNIDGKLFKDAFEPVNFNPGDHTVKYIFTTTYGCIDSTIDAIKILPLPTVNAGPDKVIDEGEKVQINATSNGNNFEWSPPNFINNINVLNPVVQPNTSTDYTLTVSSIDGCKASDYVRIQILKDLLVPGAFSPNGDGINDTWKIPYIQNLPDAVVQIFDRGGKLIFYSIGYLTPWDGTYRGEPLPAGNYVWIIQSKMKHKLIRGNVVLVR